MICRALNHPTREHPRDPPIAQNLARHRLDIF
jgi:hypothetical protein